MRVSKAAQQLICAGAESASLSENLLDFDVVSGAVQSGCQSSSVLHSSPMVLALSGCVPYPIYKTLQPAARAIVHDPVGLPVQSARVTLISNSYPYGREKSRETKETDSEGSAKFESKKEWRAEIIMIHGAEVYFWNWSVEKPGFKTYVSSNSSADTFSREPTIILTEGVSTPCPAQFR